MMVLLTYIYFKPYINCFLNRSLTQCRRSTRLPLYMYSLNKLHRCADSMRLFDFIHYERQVNQTIDGFSINIQRKLHSLLKLYILS